MQAIIPIVVSITVIFLMWIVGLQLTLADFRRIAQRPKVSVVGVFGQFVTMPLLAAVLITLFRPAESIAAGIVLIASAPGAPISNLLVYLGRGNTALSVTMTAVTNTIGIVTFPLLASAGFLLLLGESVDIQISPGPMIGQLILLMLLPIAVGMITRKYRPNLAEQRDAAFRITSLLMIAVSVELIILDQKEIFLEHLGSVAAISTLMTATAMAAGFSLGVLIRVPRADRIAYLVEFSARNNAIAMLVAVTLMGRADYAAIIITYFVAQIVLTLAVLTLMRATGPGRVGRGMAARE